MRRTCVRQRSGAYLRSSTHHRARDTGWEGRPTRSSVRRIVGVAATDEGRDETMPGQRQDLDRNQAEELGSRIGRLVLRIATNREPAGYGSTDALMTSAPECEPPEWDRRVHSALRIEPFRLGPDRRGSRWACRTSRRTVSPFSSRCPATVVGSSARRRITGVVGLRRRSRGHSAARKQRHRRGEVGSQPSPPRPRAGRTGCRPYVSSSSCRPAEKIAHSRSTRSRGKAGGDQHLENILRCDPPAAARVRRS